MMHCCLILVFLLLFGGMLQKKIKYVKIISAILASIIYFTCAIDYTVALYRGLGLVKSDISRDSTLLILLSKTNFPTGTKFYISLFLLTFAYIIYTLSWIKKVSPKLIRISSLCCVICILGYGIISDYPNETELFQSSKIYSVNALPESDWFESNIAIFHALGETADGTTLTNSYNALEYNYARGVRTFETDISFTSDGVPVLRHDWGSDLGQGSAFGWGEEGYAVSLDTFLSAPIYDKFTPMSLLDLFLFMDKHKDVYVVFDTKLTDEYSVSEQYRIIYNVAVDNQLDSVLSRIVVQLYYYSMYEEVSSVFPMKNALLTMYVIGEQPYNDIYSFLVNHNINVLTVPSYFDKVTLCNYMAPKGVKIYTHTYNDPNDVIVEFGHGVDGFYTDSITPSTLEYLKEYAVQSTQSY